MTLQDYFRVLRRGWWVMLLFTVAGVGAAAAYTVTTPPVYFSAATVYVAISGNESPGDLQQGGSFALQRVSTYADLASTENVLQPAAESLGTVTESQLRSSITSVARDARTLIDITAQASSGVDAADRANAVAAALTSAAALLDAPSASSSVQLTVVQPAVAPDAPAAPRPRNNLLIGLAVGLALGLVTVVVLHALTNQIRTVSDLPPAVDLATRTSIPASRRRRSGRSAGTDARVESFRNLRANLQFGSHVGTVIAVAGVTGRSNAQAVARQLAAAWVEIGSVVVVVDLDFRMAPRSRGRSSEVPVLHLPGLADVLSDNAMLDDVVRQNDDDKLHSIPAGAIDASSAQRLSTGAMADIIQRLAARFDRVVLACPPLVERSESSVAAALAGNALVVIESGATTKGEFAFALELLQGVRVPSVSVVVDNVREADMRQQSQPSASPMPAVGV